MGTIGVLKSRLDSQRYSLYLSKNVEKIKLSNFQMENDKYLIQSCIRFGHIPVHRLQSL